jgi:uncharacterized protein
MRTSTCLIMFLSCWSGSAFALDCSKALTPDEKAICASPSLLALDAKLNAAFKALLLAATPDGKDNLRKSQRLWLRNDRNCEGEAACLANAIPKRMRAFGAEAATGPGTGSPMTFAAWADDSANWSLLEGPRFAVADAPYKKAWNKMFDAAVDVRRKNPTPAVEEDLGDDPNSHNFLSEEISVTFASPTLLSGLHYSSSYYAGAAHPDWTETKINLYVPSGKTVSFDELIIPQKVEGLVQLCANQAETVEGVTDEFMPALKSAVTDLTNWSFFEDEVNLTFAPYTIGGYNQVISGCKFSVKELKPFMKKSFKAWP